MLKKILYLDGKAAAGEFKGVIGVPRFVFSITSAIFLKDLEIDAVDLREKATSAKFICRKMPVQDFALNAVNFISE